MSLRGNGIAGILAVVLTAGAAALPAPAPAWAAEVESVAVEARPIANFRIGGEERDFGPFEFIGGLEMTARARDFGAISSFRFLSPGSRFIGVADTGFWFFGTIERGADGVPTGVGGFSMQQMVDADGQPIDRKWEVDAEGLDVQDGIATVGFERNHRIARFTIAEGAMGPATGTVPFLVPAQELRQNKGFETVVRAHPSGQHEGGLVVVSERSIDKKGNVFAAIIEGPAKGVFTIRRDDDFDITDGAFLPDGDLLLLERRYTIAQGVAMRLRRIYGESIAKDSIADGPVLMSADMGYQIDNMEAMDVWRRPDGALMVSLMSDDNHSMLQRNLYLEFRLHEDRER